MEKRQIFKISEEVLQKEERYYFFLWNDLCGFKGDCYILQFKSYAENQTLLIHFRPLQNGIKMSLRRHIQTTV